MAPNEREHLDTIIATLGERIEGAVEAHEEWYGDLVIVVPRNLVHEVMKELRREGFDLLLDIAGVDLLKVEHKDRFQVVYNLYSISKNLRLRVKTNVPEDDMNVPSVADLWQSANWAEREAYDMFGFNFEGHPNLSRILCHREFTGHALRKDYPVMKGQWATTTSDLIPDLDKE